MICISSGVGILVYMFLISNEAIFVFLSYGIFHRSSVNCVEFLTLYVYGRAACNFSISVRKWAIL
jgi:hypothetical protein